MMEAVPNFKMEFHKDIEILKMTWTEVKMELKTPITQLEKSGNALQAAWIKQKIKISSLEEEVENLD